MNRKLVIAISLALGIVAVRAATVSNVKLEQTADGSSVRIDYTLTESAIVTWSLQTNAVAGSAEGWVTVPEERTNTRVWGDINRVVKGTSCTFYWAISEALPNQTFAKGCARAIITAWPLTNPPTYMVADMIGGPNIRYYTSAEALPEGGLANDIYKQSKMVFRKIPAKDVIWTMGVSETGDADAYNKFGDNEKTQQNLAHKVKLTYDYYIGIYEITRAQWGCVTGEKGGYGNWKGGYGWCNGNLSVTNTIPATALYLGALRNADDLSNTDTFCGRLRLFHGSDYAFDVVSSAEWEFAYRAGEPLTLYTGGKWSDNADMRACGNVDRDLEELKPASGSILPVGTAAPPNRWGLYDMFGNAADGVRDHGNNWLYWQDRADYKETGICVDPVMEDESYYVGRGCYPRWSQAWIITLGCTWTFADSSLRGDYGFRLVCPIPKE